MEEFKRKLTAILSADVEGYSRLMGEDEDSTVRTLKAYRELIAEAIQNRRGRVVDSPGDNVLAEFGSVVDAVRCAVEIQEKLKTRNAQLPENRQMKFRIGVNLGDVIQDEERIYGDGVNIAARVEGLAEGEGICISGSAYEQIKNKMTLGYEYLGEHAVKNIAEPVPVYRALMEPEAAGKVIGEKRPKPRQWRRAAVGAVGLLIIVAGALAIWNFYFRPAFEPASVEKMAFPLPDEPSIAVLPFTNMSGDPQQDYLSDGLTEQIITSLSMVPRLFVIARNSTFTYKGKAVKVQQVAEEMGVRYVLEGSVQKSGERIRINAQLIDALTGRHLWAQRYDRVMKDLFALQDEIIVKIMSAIWVKLTRGEIARLGKKQTDNLEAYIKVLQAYEYFYRFNKEGNIQARKLAEEAIVLDPNYATAYFQLGQTHFFDPYFGLSKSPAKSYQEAAKLFQKALAIDESHPLASSLLAFVYGLQGQHEKSLAQAERAVALNPNMAVPNVQLGAALFRVGRYEEAIQSLEKGIRLDPKGPMPYFAFLGHAYCYAGRYEDAIATFKKAIDLAPDSALPHVGLAAVYSLAGRYEKARAEAEEVLRINPKFSLKRYENILPWGKTEKEPWLEALRKAGLPETPPLPLPDKPSIAVLPFVNMSADPEQEYFSDGITEEIITALSKSQRLFVIARESSFSFKGKPVKVQQVGRELGVKCVLEGSIRKSEDQIRITAQLIDATTGHHLWSERYDRKLQDIFALQDEITMKIMAALQVKLTDGEQAQLYAKGTDNIEAFLKCLQGREYLYRFSREGIDLARPLLKEAIALDPNYAPPYRWLGGSHMLDVILGDSKNPKKSIMTAIKLAHKAISLDESFVPAHCLLARLYAFIGEYDKAVSQAERAVAINPNSADAYDYLGVVLVQADRAVEAVPLIKKGIRLNPIPPKNYLYHLAMAYGTTEQYEEAISVSNSLLQRDPNDFLAHLSLTLNYANSGKEQEARAEAAEVRRINPKFRAEQLRTMSARKNRAYVERQIETLQKLGLK